MTAAAAKRARAETERPRKMLDEDMVLAIVPVSRSTLWRLESAGKFPRGTFISKNRKVWYEDQIVKWQTEVDERDPHRRRGPGRRRTRARETAPA